MNLAEAEAILALELEIITALKLRDSEAEFLADWRIQFAAERVLERIFQASVKVGRETLEGYFGADGVRSLRGIRNRLAHNYLEIDNEILWEIVNVDLPLVHQRLAFDALTARNVVAASLMETELDADEWRARHLRSTSDSEE